LHKTTVLDEIKSNLSICVEVVLERKAFHEVLSKGNP
jgi:hypothetical protein